MLARWSIAAFVGCVTVVCGTVAVERSLAGALRSSAAEQLAAPPGVEPSINYRGVAVVSSGRAVPQTFVVGNTGSKAVAATFRVHLPDGLRIDRRSARNPTVRRALRRYRQRRAEHRADPTALSRRRMIAALTRARLIKTGVSLPVREARAADGTGALWIATRSLRLAPGARRAAVVRLRATGAPGEADFRLSVGPPGRGDSYWTEVVASIRVSAAR